MKQLFQKYRYSLATILLSTLVFTFYYPYVSGNLDTVLFSDSGDGLQNYYSMMYHIEHDEGWFRQDHMNYPYGENIIFTGGQPVLSNILKVFTNGGDSVKPVLFSYNFIMVLSIILAPLFLYLIFRRVFDISVLPAILFAMGIAFLSPQIDRLPGHYPLSFVCAIPCFIYLLYLFDNKKTIWRSAGLALYTFLIASFHLYYLGFFAIITLVYFLATILRDKEFVWKSVAIKTGHLFLQVFLPFIVLKLISTAGVDVTDRTDLPWGYFVYTSNLSGVFLQSPTMPEFISRNIHWTPAEWEGVAYVGLFAIVMGIIAICWLIKDLIQRRFRLNLNSPHRFWSMVLLIAGFCGLIYSFAIPLKWSDYLFSHSGPLKQMRGVGRFAWLFFYTLNILAVVWLVRLLKNTKLILNGGVLAICIAWLFYEAHIHNKDQQARINNYYPELLDTDNKLPANQWINDFPFSDYQAIIPMPFFLIGSENYVIDIEDPGIKRISYLISLKSGMPMMAMSGSRSSREQSLKISKLFMEPYDKPEYLEDLPSDKPFLIVRLNRATLRQGENRILEQADSISDYGSFSLYSIAPHKLDRRETARKRFLHEAELHDTLPDSVYTVTIANYIEEDYESTENQKGFRSEGAYTGKIRDYNLIFEGELDHSDHTSWAASFWMKDITKDVYPRTFIEVAITTNANTYAKYFMVFRNCRQIAGDWAMVEMPFSTNYPGEEVQNVKFTVYNQDIYDSEAELIIDDFLLRPSREDVYRTDPGDLRKNNILIPELLN